MNTFIVGHTGTGKSTLARRLANNDGRRVISAGGWIREHTGCQTHSVAVAQHLAKTAHELLQSDPAICSRWLLNQIAGEDVIIEGIRNPFDLLSCAKAGDHVTFIESMNASSQWEDAGVGACRGLIKWLEHNGITTSIVTRNIAKLVVPIKVEVLETWLHDLDPTYKGSITGQIIALETYPGHEVTCMFMATSGGTFHDIPLEAFRLSKIEGNLDFEDRHCYSNDDVGSACVELPPMDDTSCRIFSRARVECGYGKALMAVHWPDGNLLMWLVHAGDKLILWPPHKLMFGNTTDCLPDWKKLHRIN